MIKAILFDLDGTLLPLDQEIFTKYYFGGLTKRLAPFGYDPQKLIQTVWAGTKGMGKNDGQKTNEEVFWDVFASVFGEEARKDIAIFKKFYQEDFVNVKNSCTFNPKAKEVVDFAKNLGFKLVLATNPIFPSIATQQRIDWAGLKTSDFEFFTSYENSNFCKPNLEYYKFILKKLNLSPEECLMVGNDVSEDMVAEKLGIKVFLLTDCIINKENKDISLYPHGNFEQLKTFISNLNK